MAPHGVYPAKGHDRWITIAVGGEREWHDLAALIGQSAPADDPRLAAEAARHANRVELDPIVARWTVTLPADAAAELLQAAGIAAHTSWTTSEIAGDPHLRERDTTVAVTEPGTPRLGENEDYVFGGLLGLSHRERRSLEDAEVIYRVWNPSEHCIDEREGR